MSGFVEINILGTNYKIIENKLDDSGQCDWSTKTITIDESLNRCPEGNDMKNLLNYKCKVTRHEIIHAMLFESGSGTYDDMHNERFVDWIAYMYPKIKAIFEKLNIEV